MKFKKTISTDNNFDGRILQLIISPPSLYKKILFNNIPFLFQQYMLY